MKLTSCFLSILILSLSLTSLSEANESSSQNAADFSSKAQTTTAISSRAGWRVYIDPITKELRTEYVTAEEAAYFDFDVLPAPDYSRMQTEVLPTGTRILHIDGEVQMTSVGYLDSDGTTRETCFTTAAPLEKSTTTQQEKVP